MEQELVLQDGAQDTTEFDQPAEEQVETTTETDATEDTEGQEAEQGEEQEETAQQEDQQALIARIAQRERERGRLQMEREMAPALQAVQMLQAMYGHSTGQAPDINSLPDLIRQDLEKSGIEVPQQQAIGLSDREQQVLGMADAAEEMQYGVESAIQSLRQYQAEKPTTARDVAKMNSLMQYVQGELDKTAVEQAGIGANVLQDTGFNEFRSKLNNVPAVEAYRMYQKITGTQPQKPASTGSAKSTTEKQGAFFTHEQVDAMSPSEIKKNFKQIEQSMKHWK